MKLFKHIIFKILLALLVNQSIFAGIEPDGSYTHVIPIEIPKSINDVQPNLALVYNYNAGNGILGARNWGR
ncbi:MAG: hypothetical protein MJE63_03160 [Proteobacteria bacterium]|nr:hypothetical protein [Pseudomonadota bacterium]